MLDFQTMVAFIGLPILANAWEVYVYDNVDNCKPTGASNEQAFSRNRGRNGGNANPTACDGTDLTADSAILSEIKDAGAKPNRYGMHLLRSGRLQ
ncbi:hypothetical protein EYB26_003719 [Talaromyces marneffei]|uniref:uncharacterized protein n=1 Tax=Talaromyces marneffei TaxID=37727 RepID=UPI0012AA51C2|nr:uncharacterized protein EYB26_003719 [Talaromyces marneffei]QGA16052.1 hypothetical protein EYB26_003719 [Talaromyces marneffei]